MIQIVPIPRKVLLIYPYQQVGLAQKYILNDTAPQKVNIEYAFLIYSLD